MSFTASTSGYYYIRVQLWSGSGSSASYYRLYPQVSGQRFQQSFYIFDSHSDTWMNTLGRDYANNIGGLVIIDFNAPQKQGSTYGIQDYKNQFTKLTSSNSSDYTVKRVVEQFIQGYNANPKHDQDITVLVSINNKSIGSNPISSAADFTAHGLAWYNMVNSISTSGHVTGIHSGIDAEWGYNNPAVTRAWVDGYASGGATKRLYNFGDHQGDTSDWSGQANPSWVVSGKSYSWSVDDVYHISWEVSNCYCLPQIYNARGASTWTWQKKWTIRQRGRTPNYLGLLSTNGWDDLYSNQTSYTTLYNNLTNASWNGSSLQEPLENPIWIVYSSPAQPN